MGVDAIPHIMGSVRDGLTSDYGMWHIDTILEQMGAQAVPLLLVFATDENREVQICSFVALALLSDERAFHLFVERTSGKAFETDRALFNISIAGLVRVGQVGVPYLESLLFSPFVEIQIEVLNRISVVKDERLTEPLIHLLDHMEPAVRGRAIFALAHIGKSVAMPFALRMLVDGNSNVRHYAIRSLGLLKSRDAVKPLIKLLLDKDETSNRTEIMKALALIGDYDAVPVLLTQLSETKESYDDIAVALGDFKEIDPAPLIDLLSGSPNAQVRRSAVLALGLLGNKSTLPSILSATHDIDTNVRIRALYACAEIQEDTAVEQVVRYLQSFQREELDRLDAYCVLREISSAKTTGARIQLCTCPYEDIRGRAETDLLDDLYSGEISAQFLLSTLKSTNSTVHKKYASLLARLLLWKILTPARIWIYGD